MADAELTDFLGRSLDMLGGVENTLSTLRQLLQTTQTRITSPEGAAPDLSSLRADLEKIISGFGEAARAQADYANKVADALKGVDAEKTTKREQTKLNKKRLKEEEKYLKKLKTISERMFGNIQEQNIDKLEAAIRQFSQREGKSISNVISQLGNVGGKVFEELKELASGYSVNQLQQIFDETERIVDLTDDYGNSIGYAKTKTQIWHDALYGAKNQLGKISEFLRDFETGVGLDTMKGLFSDLYETEMKFTQEMRQLAYETAGATKEAFGLQRAFENIGQSVKTTGFDRTKFQESYRKALKGGVKDLKQAVSLTTTQLNTEKQLGMEAGSLQENFQQFALSGRMSASQIAAMGRGMREVARSTGLTGEALKGVVDSGMQFVDQMRKASTLSASASRNIFELGANAKKLGVEEEMNKLRSGLASSTSLLTEAAGETQTLIFLAASRVGRIQDAMNGTLLRSKEGIKDFAKGMKSILQGFGVDSLEAIDQLGDEAKRTLNLQLKATVGMELGAFRSIIESYEQAGQSLGERLDSINKKMTANLTINEKNALIEEQRQLKAAKQLEILNVLDESAKGAANMSDALAKFGEKRKDFEKDIAALGIDFKDDADVIRGALKGAVKDINAGLVKAGKSQIKIDTKDIEKALQDPAAMRELTSQIVKGEQELATAQKAQLDPISQTNQTLSEINDGIRGLTQSLISTVMSSLVGQLLMIGGVLAGIGVGIYQLANKFYEAYEALRLIQGHSSYYSETNSLLKNIETLIQGRPVAPTTTHPSPVAEAGKEKTTEASATGTPAKGGGGGMFGNFGDLFTADNGKQMAKMAAGILAISVGIVALGSAIVFLADKVMSSFDLDVNKVMQTAQLVGAIAMAGGAIAAAGIGAFVLMTSPEAENFMNGFATNKKKFLKMAAAILILGPAIVGLGAAITAITNYILSSLSVDTNKVLEVAGVVASLAAAATGIIVGVIGFTQAIKDNKDMIDEIINKSSEYLGYMFRGGLAIFALSVGIVTLAALIVKSSQYILGAFGIDPQVAEQVAENIASLFKSVAIISVAVVATAGALVGLGVLAAFLVNPIAGVPGGLTAGTLMFLGAGALLALSFVMPLLAAAIISFASAGNSFYGGEQAIAAAENVGKLLLAAGAIALGVLGATAGLIGLGALVYGGEAGLTPQGMAGLMLLGAAALLTLSYAIPLLAGAVISVANASMGQMGMDPAYAAQVAETFSSIMVSAGKIALGVLGATAALVGLGYLALQGPILAASLVVGAAALYFLIDPITKLASSIIQLTSQVLNEVVSPKDAEDAGKAVASIFGAVGTIAWEISKAAAGLATLGSLSVLTAGLLPVLMQLGNDSLEEMIEPVIDYVGKVMNLGRRVAQKVNPADAEKISTDIKSIFDMAANVSKLIYSDQGGLLNVPKYGDWWNYTKSFVGKGKTVATRMSEGLDELGDMTGVVLRFFDEIKKIADNVGSKFAGGPEAKKQIKEVAEILTAAATVTVEIMKAKDSLLTLQAGDWTSYIPSRSVSQRMTEGAKVLKNMSVPITNYLAAVVDFGRGVKVPSEMKSIASGLGQIFASAADVTDGVLKSKDKLLNLQNRDWATFFDFGTITQRMRDGVNVLRQMKQPLTNYIVSIVEIGNEFKSKMGISPGEIQNMAAGLSMVFDAAGTITEKINEQRGKMMKLAASSRVAGENKTFVAQIDKAKITLMLVRGAITNYVKSSMEFAKELIDMVPNSEAKKTMANLEDVSKIIGLTAKIFGQMKGEVVPILTKGEYAKKDPTADIMSAQTKIRNFFPAFVLFNNTIRNEVKKIGSDLGEYQETIKNIYAMTDVMKSLGGALAVLAVNIVPLTKNDAWVGDTSQLHTIKLGLSNLAGENGTLSWIEWFVRTSLTPTMRSMNLDDLKESGLKLNLLGSVLEELFRSVSNLSKVHTVQSQRTTQIFMQKMTELETYVESLGKFVTGRLMQSINDLPDSSKLKNARIILEDLSEVLRSTMVAVVSLNEVFDKMKKEKDFWSDDPDQLKKQQKLFIEKFQGMSGLILDGIVNPVLKSFRKDSVQLGQAAAIIQNLAIVAEKTPAVIHNLMNAMAAISKLGGTNPNQKPGEELRATYQVFDEYKKDFSKYLPLMFSTIDTVILGPMMKHFGKYDMVKISSMATGIVNVIRGTLSILNDLNSVMSQMSDPEKKTVDPTKVIDRIMKYKGAFSGNFVEILKFVQNDIVGTVVKHAINPDDMNKASSALSAMTQLFGKIPQLFAAINAMNSDLDPLKPIAPGTTDFSKGLGNILKDLKSNLIDKQETFTQYSNIPIKVTKTNRLETLIDFINESIIPPLNKIPNPEQLQIPIQKLEKLTTMLDKVGNLLSMRLAPLLIRTSGNLAVVKELGENKGTFVEYFTNIEKIITKGLIEMVNKLPDENVLPLVNAKVAAAIKIMDATQPLFNRLSLLIQSVNDNSLVTLSKNYPDMEKLVLDSVNFIKDGIASQIDKNLQISGATIESNVKNAIQVLDSAIPMFQKLGEFLTFLMTGGSSFPFTYLANNYQYHKNMMVYTTGIVWRFADNVKENLIYSSADITPKIENSIKILESGKIFFEKLAEFAKAIQNPELETLSKDYDYWKNRLYNLILFVNNGISYNLSQGLSTFTEVQPKIDSTLKILTGATLFFQKLKEFSGVAQNLAGIDLSNIDKIIKDSIGKMTVIDPAQLEKMEAVVSSYEKFYSLLSRLETAMTGVAEKLKSISAIKIETPAVGNLTPPSVMTPEKIVNETAPKTPSVMTPEKIVNETAPKKKSAFQTAFHWQKKNLGIPEASEETKKRFAEMAKEGSTAATAATVATANASDIEAKILAQRASTNVATSKVTSDELSEIVDENADQNTKLQTLIDLFSKVVTLLTPSTTATSRGETSGNSATTMLNAKKLPPPRYARATSGLPDMQPGKAVQNMGQVIP